MHTVFSGVVAIKSHAHEVARLAAQRNGLVMLTCYTRAAIDLKVLPREAMGHSECQLLNGGFAKSQISTHSSSLQDSLHLLPMADRKFSTRQASVISLDLGVSGSNPTLQNWLQHASRLGSHPDAARGAGPK